MRREGAVFTSLKADDFLEECGFLEMEEQDEYVKTSKVSMIVVFDLQVRH